MLVKELKEKLKSYGLSTVGLKQELEARLETYLYKYGGAPIDDIIKELDMLRMQSRGNDIEVKIFE